MEGIIQYSFAHRFKFPNDIDEINSIIKNEKEIGMRIGLTNGCFDIIHSAHVKMLHEARNSCDRLIVAINDDESVRMLKGESRPINTLEDRMTVLSSIKDVFMVIAFSGIRADNLFCNIYADAYYKGGDYTFDSLDKSEKDALRVKNPAIEFNFIRYIEGISTTSTIKRIRSLE